jgi:hypothetical protein
MEGNFKDMDDTLENAPEALRGMITSEVDIIRDTMVIVGMFLGETMLAALTMVQELDAAEKK